MKVFPDPVCPYAKMVIVPVLKTKSRIVMDKDHPDNQSFAAHYKNPFQCLQMKIAHHMTGTEQ